ncbi:WecB/TagA/CpsF family glycosyltransferase [Elioraea sp.]|uniref:WecB/TagA/CpsF family glycosyltransferase n=1 Tax=Elioraea sp. TaxID=2185103 RepID=UPI0025B8D5E9|nr:WecB/TagA/CpsF family glycosyltransferase [Elioraea sp.]
MSGFPLSPAFPLAPDAEAVPLLGLRFAGLGLPEVLATLAARPADAPFAYVVTPNADHLVRLSKSPALGPLYADAGLTLLDSRVVAKLGRALGLAPPPVVTGSDLTAALFASVLRPSDRIAVIGSSAEAVAMLAERHGLTNIVHHNPPMGFDRDPAAFAAAIEVVRAARARFVFLAVGSPRQEKLAHAVLAAGDATGIGLCIGASLDFLTGAQARAPGWMQRAGIEWLHRLASDPGRLAKRYLVDDLPILRLLAADAWKRRADKH